MKGMIRSRIALLVILILFIHCNYICASKIRPDYYFDVSKEVKPWPLYLGDEVEIIFTIQSEHDFDNVVIWVKPSVTGGAMISYLEPLGFAARDTMIEKIKENLGINRMLSFSIKKGEEKRFRLKAKINDVIHEDADIGGEIFGIGISMHSSSKEYSWCVGSEGLILYLVDPKRELLGTLADKKRGLPIIYRYSADERKVYPPGMLELPGDVERNREIIAMMRDLEPSLSDSEALLLHADLPRIGKPRGASNWTEMGIYRYYVDDGWVEAMRAAKRQEWINQERIKIAGTYKRKFWNIRNFPIFLGLICFIALIFLIIFKIKDKRSGERGIGNEIDDEK
jgi:hypothetical protein